MSEFSREAAEKALNLCFEYSEDADIKGVLDAAKKTYDFLIGESHHFNNSEKDIISFNSVIQEYIKNGQPVDFEKYLADQIEHKKSNVSIIEQRIQCLRNQMQNNTPLKRLRAYEKLYGKLDTKFDYLLD